jgi:hypothetical protein
VYGLRPYKTQIVSLWKKFFREVALFSLHLRVSGCGLFFAGVNAAIVLAHENYGTVWREIRWIQSEPPITRKIAMSEKKTIRIIKKGEKSRPVVKAKANAARETARDMVETVTNWVNEFQQRRRAETTNALRILAKTPRGSEA